MRGVYLHWLSPPVFTGLLTVTRQGWTSAYKEETDGGVKFLTQITEVGKGKTSLASGLTWLWVFVRINNTWKSIFED